jgi:hypothetical protein
VSPEHVADKILRGVTKNRFLIYTSADIRAIHEIQNRIPPLYVLIMRTVNRLANRAIRMPSGAAR